jgi:hypothetical protein
MATLADVYRALNAMQAEGIVEKYAVGDGMAALFYAETTRTYDIDIFVLLKQQGLLVDLSSIYNWARERGYPIEGEHIWIHGVAVQFFSAKDGLETEAIEHARILDYDGVAVPVMAPEYLAILYVLVGGAKRRNRAYDLLEAGTVSDKSLHEILARHDLTKKWQEKWKP